MVIFILSSQKWCISVNHASWHLICCLVRFPSKISRLFDMNSWFIAQNFKRQQQCNRKKFRKNHIWGVRPKRIWELATTKVEQDEAVPSDTSDMTTFSVSSFGRHHLPFVACFCNVVASHYRNCLILHSLWYRDFCASFGIYIIWYYIFSKNCLLVYFFWRSSLIVLYEFSDNRWRT